MLTKEELLEKVKECPFYNQIPVFFTNEDKENFYGKHAFRKYAFYYTYVKLFKPETILEIGVRNGYSLLSMMSADENVYIDGVDNETEKTFENVKKYKNENVRLIHETSDKFFEINRSQVFGNDKYQFSGIDMYDLIHIDGDHSYEQCKKDITNAFEIANDIIVIDDSIAIGTVKQALEEVLEANRDKIDWYNTYDCIYGGHTIIKIK